MTYLPTDYINSNYHYYSNGTYFTIRTNKNCYTNYNSSYCDCYYIYPNQNYLVSNVFSCTGSNNQELSYSNFSDEWRYRLDVDKIFLMVFILGFVVVFVLVMFFKMLFKGVFK